MDYHTLPRRQLQTLCKKHGIPANAASSEMADALTALLKPKPQLNADNNNKQPAKRTTGSREPASSETVSMSKDVEEELKTKPQKPTNSRIIVEEELNRKPQRVTRGRGSAPKAATLKTPTNEEAESNSATKLQEVKKVSTRNSASKQTYSEMPTKEKVNSKAVSPKSDKKKEKIGGVMLRRGRVKVRSPGNLPKSPESEKISKEVAATRVGMPCSQSCLGDAKDTRKKKRSVTFSDVLEINSTCIEHPSRGVNEPAKELQAAHPNLPKSTNSARIAKRVVGTRKASRSVSTKDCVQDAIAAQADHQKSSKKPVVAKVSEAEGADAFDAKKSANIKMGGESDRKKSAQGWKILNSLGEAAAKENEEEKVADGFVKGNHIEDVPCTRRSRRLTIVPTDVKYDQDMQLASVELKSRSKEHHEGSSIAAKKIEGALPAETSHRSRRKTLAPLERNHVQSNVSKAKHTQSKGYSSELKNEALESQQSHSEINACDNTPVAIANEGVPSDGVKSVEEINATGHQLGQLSTLLPSCSAEPGIALPTESACKTKQRRPQSIYKSARKAKFSVPWENGSLEENTASPPTKEDSLKSLDQAEKGAEIWGLNSHEMSCDAGDSASSEEEERCSIAAKKTEGALPAETSHRSRWKTLAPLELNHVQSNVGSASEQEEKKVSKEKRTQSKGYSAELKDEALELQQNHSDINTCDNTLVATANEGVPSDGETLAPLELNHVQSKVGSASEQEEKKVSKAKHTQSKGNSSELKDEALESQQNHSEINICDNTPIAIANEGVPSDGVSTTDQLRQLSPLLPLCSAEPGIALPTKSACKTKQRHPRSIYKSARKAKFSVPWENGSLEENTAPPPTKEDSLHSLDQAEKDAEIWGLNSHEMSCDEGNSASSEEEESSAETEETLSDTEVCNFNTEVLISNTEGDYSCSEDDAPSDTEEDTMFDSEDDCSEMEEELLSGEECYESEELDTSEEEFSESEDDPGDDFEEYEASPLSQAVANSKCFDSLYTTHGSGYQQVEIIAASKSYLPNDGVTHAEIINCLALENVINGCALNVDPTDIDEKVGGQHEELQKTLSTHAATETQENVDVLISYNDNTAMEEAQSTTDSTCQDSDSLTSLSSLFATPASKVKEDVKCSLSSPSIDILESTLSQHSRTLEAELNILPESGQEESIQLCFPCELSHEDVVAEVEQHTMDGAEHGTELCESVSVEKELEVNGQMVELAEICSAKNPLAGPAVVDCFMVLDNVQNSQLVESNSKNSFISGKENEQIHTSASESPCLGPCELILEGNGADMGDPDICEEVIQNLNTKTDVLVVQEELDNFKSNQDGIEEDEAGNVEVKNDLDNNEGSIGMALDAQNGSEDLRDLLDLGEGTTSKLTEELMVTEVATFGSSTLAVNDKLNESETAAQQDIIFSVDGPRQKQGNEDALAFDTAYSDIGTTDTIVSLESAQQLELDMVSADDKIHLFSSSTSCNFLEEGEPLLQLECEQDLMPSDASEQSKTEATGEEPEVIQSESNVQILSSQVMASNTFEVDCCSTPKCSKDSGIVRVLNHEILDEVEQSLYCVEIENVNAQVEEVHEKPLDDSQSSEESNEDKETAVAHNFISKEQSMKQIDLTLISVRKLRQMCKENQMSAKKKTENETPARKPSNIWMSATKQVHQPNTSMHPRDLPSENKRSALQALSSNVKAAPSAAMQTPTAKVLQRPRNLMSTYDGNEGTGKHLVTPSPQAPMSSKRDFARSHHR